MARFKDNLEKLLADLPAVIRWPVGIAITLFVMGWGGLAGGLLMKHGHPGLAGFALIVWLLSTVLIFGT